MDSIDKLTLLADLAETHCVLNHGPDTDNTNYPAVDYVTIPLGKDGEVTDQLVVPVCSDCLDGLQSDEWTLLYCLECGASQWVFQPLAKLSYLKIATLSRYHLIGIVGCPKCTNKLEQIYYLDQE